MPVVAERGPDPWIIWTLVQGAGSAAVNNPFNKLWFYNRSECLRPGLIYSSPPSVQALRQKLKAFWMFSLYFHISLFWLLPVCLLFMLLFFSWSVCLSVPRRNSSSPPVMAGPQTCRLPSLQPINRNVRPGKQNVQVSWCFSESRWDKRDWTDRCTCSFTTWTSTHFPSPHICCFIILFWRISWSVLASHIQIKFTFKALIIPYKVCF